MGPHSIETLEFPKLLEIEDRCIISGRTGGLTTLRPAPTWVFNLQKTPKTIASESILFRYTVLGIRPTADVTAPKVQRTRTGKAPPLLGDPIITRVLIPLGSRAWSF